MSLGGRYGDYNSPKAVCSYDPLKQGLLTNIYPGGIGKAIFFGTLHPGTQGVSRVVVRSLLLAITVAALSLGPNVFCSTPSQVVRNGDAYLLGPEDQLSIHVTDLEDVSDKPFRVDPSGFIDLPLAGRISVAGLSVDQLRIVLSERLAKYVTAPQIAINVIEYRSQPVSVLGEVNNPGVHQLQGPKRLVDVISSAGGLKPDAGPRLTITRQARWGVLPLPNSHLDHSGQYLVAQVSLNDVTSGLDADQNIEVRADDVISVPRADVVYVVGEVKKSGSYSLNADDRISLVRALSLAEGLSTGAAPKKARIMRASAADPSKVTEIPVDLQQILAGKSPDQFLQRNDVLFVPNNVSGSAMKRAAEAAVQIATGVIIFH
jgi:polysaccharide biosynthesis/export protein